MNRFALARSIVELGEMMGATLAAPPVDGVCEASRDLEIQRLCDRVELRLTELREQSGRPEVAA